jgi:hypothetical protein
VVGRTARGARAPSMCLSLGLSAVAGCASSGFACQDDAQCQAGGVQGACEPTGGCSFEDPTCPSGRRYGDHAPAGLGGECVVDPGGSGESDSGASMSASLSEGASSGLTAGATVTGDGDTTASSDASSTVAVSATDDGTGTSGASAESDGSTSAETTTGGNAGGFYDAFDRPDAESIGNGWIEKTPTAFRLADEQVALETTNGLDFRDNLVYRPLDESLLDVEVSTVLNFYTDEPFGYPQLHMRVQAGDVATGGSLTSYAVFVDSADPLAPQLTVNRIDGPGFGPSQSEPIVPAPIDNATYRLRGRVTGTDPVVVEGWFEVWIAPEWQVVTTATFDDATAQRLTDPGTVGMSGHLELQHFQLDDFTYDDLGG